MRLLIIEDDVTLQDGLNHCFKKSGYAVDLVNDGAKASALLSYQRYDVILLDLGLPSCDGFEVLKRMRAKGNNTPVLILSAYEDIKNRVKGLDFGADDFLGKPFDLAELEARVRALVRRGISGGSAKIYFAGLEFCTSSRQCVFNGNHLSLSNKESVLLELLMLKANKVVSKSKIVEHLYNFNESQTENAVEAIVSRLRKKLNSFNIEIKTIRGLGYLLLDNIN